MTASGYIPLRIDLPDLLGKPMGRKDGHYLSALGVGVRLAEVVDWRTNRLDEFSSVAFAKDQHMNWRRFRKALGYLTNSGLAKVNLKPFNFGTAELASRENPKSLLHDQSRVKEQFVALSRGSLQGIASEHCLSWVASSLLVALLLLVDHRSAQLDDDWTKTRLSDHFGIGWRRLSSGLNELDQAGLIQFQVRRGKNMSLTLLARDALVAITAPPIPKRHERRQILRDSTKGTGVSEETCQKILSHYGVSGTPSRALVRAIGEALAMGISPHEIIERMVARGSLTKANDPMAVLVSRARQIVVEITDSRQQIEKRQLQEKESAKALLDQKELEELKLAIYQDESRWLASVIEVIPDVSKLNISPLVSSNPRLLAAHIHSRCSELITQFPELDPTELIQKWINKPSELESVDVSGVNHSVTGDVQPGAIPRSRAGPTLVEKLRQTRN
ncbi:MAG: hypothetical protein HKL80_05615 [Acidimicrobiales bacterium]|nr:hypothetical protein [Acidimicrobiales bacterium]